MQTNYLSATATALNASLVATAAWDSRSPAISQKETKRTTVRGVGFAFLLAAFLGLSVTTELRAQVIVVPNALATNDGNGTSTSTEGHASVRWSHIHDASQFAALSGPSLLTQFAYRPDEVPGQSGPRSWTLKIYASTTSRSVDGLSTTFAENLGTNNTLVFDGTVNVTTENLPGPGNTRQFDYVFPFTTPFLYDPAAGNLVLDLQIEADGSALTFDTVSEDPAIGRVFYLGSSTATTGDIRFSHVTQFTFEPRPKVTVRLGQAVYWTTEGNDTVWLTIERGNDVAQEPFTVQYATSDLTAKAGLDYETAAGVLSFAPGETNKTVAIKIFNDELQENEETFLVTLSNLTGWAQLGVPATATVKILQDTVLRALNSGANLTHTQERESVTFSLASSTGPISVLGDLPELGNNNPNNAVRLVRGTDSVWRATVSLPADRAYTYRFYIGSTPVSDPITAQTRSVSRQPAAKILYYHSSLSNPVLNWRQLSNGAFTPTPMLRIGPGREVGESLWLAAGVGESGREIEFFIAEPAAAGRDPALGSHWTCLDAFFLQDGHLFNYVPAARVSPHRRDYDPDAPPSIRSEILNADRRYRVMLPRGYAEHPRRHYPVIYFHDGGAQWEIFPGGIGRTVVDPEGDIMAGLIRQGIMGEVIAVGIDIDTAAPNPPDARTRDYIPPGDQFSRIQGAADKYVQYIIQELKPLIDARYRTRPGPESTFTAGQSRGANVALYMTWDFPHVFTRAGMHSGAFEQAPNFTARVKQEPKRDIRIYLDSGEDYLSGVLALRDNLVAKSPPYVIEDDLRYVYSRGQQHLTEDFGSRRPMMLSFLHPVTEETNELFPRLEFVTQSGMRFLRIAGPAGLPGRLQRSTDLREWSDWQAISFGSEPVEISDPQTATATRQFYRVIAP